MFERKTQYRNAVDTNPQKVLNAVGPVEIMKTQQTHRRQHQNAIAGAKVAAIHGGEELKNYRSAPVKIRLIPLFDRTETQAFVDCSLRHEQDGGKENEEGNQTREGWGWRADQEPRSYAAANDAGNSQANQDM